MAAMSGRQFTCLQALLPRQIVFRLVGATARLSAQLLRPQLERISKTPQQDDDAGELDEAEEVLDVTFVPGVDAAEVLQPREQALNLPTSSVPRSARPSWVGDLRSIR